MFVYSFMHYAFLASTFIAITYEIVSVYVVVRGFSFLAHTLSEVGFIGAAFAVWIGWIPLWGMALFTLLGSISIGELSTRSDQKEFVISVISALFTDFGVLLLAITGGNSRYATNVLLGSIIGADREGVIQLVILSIFVLVIIFLFLRKLNYDPLDHAGAVSHRINTGLVSVVLLIALALAISTGTQVVGSLLVFILLTLSPSSARYLGRAIPTMLCWSVGIALAGIWIGLVLRHVTNLPATFFISIIEVGIYLFAYGVHAIKK